MSERTDRDQLIDLIAILYDTSREQAVLIIDESERNLTETLDKILQKLPEERIDRVASTLLSLGTCRTITPVERAVLDEREKQRQKWTKENDDGHDNGQLAYAAGLLAIPLLPPIPGLAWAIHLRNKHARNRKRQLTIAAALILAELERLDRAPRGEEGLSKNG